jgi:hypothetical protein
MAAPIDDATRRLPQGCQVDRAYTDEEWRAFLACARKGFETGEGIHREFYAKIEAHSVRESEILATLRARGAKLVAYEHLGMGRIAMWVEQLGILVIGTEKEGLILSAFEPPDIDRYVEGMAKVRWLRR